MQSLIKFIETRLLSKKVVVLFTVVDLIFMYTYFLTHSPVTEAKTVLTNLYSIFLKSIYSSNFMLTLVNKNRFNNSYKVLKTFFFLSKLNAKVRTIKIDFLNSLNQLNLICVLISFLAFKFYQKSTIQPVLKKN